MDQKEKKIWQTVSIAGTFITGACLVISIFQFFSYKINEPFLVTRFDSLTINTVAFVGYLYLLFNPLHFTAHVIVMYVYGIGNFLDGGNVIGLICIIASAVFLYFINFFKNHMILKIIAFSIIPIASVFMQIFFEGPLMFWISAMHILGALFMMLLVFLLFYPRLKELGTQHFEKKVDSSLCTTQDLDFLTRVLAGEKYSAIAAFHNISESKLKARMLELYKILEVKDRVEFLMIYSNTSFVLENNTAV